MRSPLKNGVYRLIAGDLPCAACLINESAAVFPPVDLNFEVTDGELGITLAFVRQNTFGSTPKENGRDGLIPQGLPKKITLYELKGKE